MFLQAPFTTSLHHLLDGHPVLPFLFRHLFDGVTEGGARHVVGMLAEEVAEEVHRDALAQLAEHPADSLVHEIVGMVEMDLGIAETPGGVAKLGGLPRANHTHALLPEVGAVGEGIENA